LIGFSPRQVDEMTLWEFNACAATYAKAHGAENSAGGGGKDIPDDRLRELGIDGFNG